MDDMISFLIEYFSIRMEDIESTGSNANGTYIRCFERMERWTCGAGLPQ
jgi:hypothetical protein